MKILCIHASAGAGHLKAAEALYDGLKKHTKHDVVLVDALDYGVSFFKKMYRGGYIFMVSNIPFVWAIAFAILDWPPLQPVIRFARRIYNSIMTRKLHQYLVDEQFDVILSTHFLTNEVASALRRKGAIQSKIICALTDYDVHKIWLGSHVDIYAAASDWTKNKFIELGVPAEKIFVTGVPTHEKFSNTPDIKELKKTLGVKEDLFSVLIATGSFGFGPIEETISSLKDFQILVVCGHNDELYNRLKEKNHDNVVVFGLVDNMHEIMAVSDAMITKPGGLSISEALVSQLPLIFFHPIPGQEINNINVLATYGVGISDCKVQQMVAHLNMLKSSKDTFLTALKKTKVLAKPNAVRDVIELINSII